MSILSAAASSDMLTHDVNHSINDSNLDYQTCLLKSQLKMNSYPISPVTDYLPRIYLITNVAPKLSTIHDIENLVTQIKPGVELSGMPVAEVPAAPRRAVCCAGPIPGLADLISLANRWAGR